MAWRRGQVVKAEVCKTSIHRFDSGRRLHLKKGTRLCPFSSFWAFEQTSWAADIPEHYLARNQATTGL